ncbi:MAG TPA: hypothetical protein VJB87_03280 [Candidatus Nanoarchaeia archaeon]|nr:hypothetical protein [Candidatus Nanoarchaeia archaeon]
MDKKGEIKLFWIAIILIIAAAFTINILGDSTTGEATRTTPTVTTRISYQAFSDAMLPAILTRDYGIITIKRGRTIQGRFEMQETRTYDTKRLQQRQFLETYILSMRNTPGSEYQISNDKNRLGIFNTVPPTLFGIIIVGRSN